MVAVLVLTAGLAGCTSEPPLACSDDVILKENVQILLETTLGNLTVELYADKTPVTASNFAALVRDGKYDGVAFHRIMTDFMVQGGDYTMGNGRGGLAHSACDADGDGNIPDEFHPDLRHDRKGLLSMANRGPDTGGSQFFITFVPTPWLDEKHAIFGEVVGGMDVLDRINDEAATQSGTPAMDVTLISARIVE